MSTIHLIRMGLRAQILIAAIAAAISPVTARAATRTFRAEISSNVTLTNVYCIYVARWGEDWFESGTKLTDSLAADTLSEFVFSMEVEDAEAVYAPLNLSYSILGQYQGGVSITLDSNYAASATQAGVDWSQAFASQYYYKSEDDVTEYLVNGDLGPFFLAWFSGRVVDGQLPSIGDSGRLVQFSAAEYGGSAALTIVPEPSAIAIATLGTAALLLLRHPNSSHQTKNRAKSS